MAQPARLTHLYHDDAEFGWYAHSLTQQGWFITHRQRNHDGTLSVTWQRAQEPASEPASHRWLRNANRVLAVLVGVALIVSAVVVYGGAFTKGGTTPSATSTYRTPPTATVASAAAALRADHTPSATTYYEVDVRDLKKSPAAYKGRPIQIQGEVFNISEVTGGTYLQMWVSIPGGTEFDREAVVVIYQGRLPSIYEKSRILVSGLGADTTTVKNGYGATITQPAVLADRVELVAR